MTIKITDDLQAEVSDRDKRITLISPFSDMNNMTNILIDEDELPKLIQFLQSVQERFGKKEPTPTEHPVNPFNHPA